MANAAESGKIRYAGYSVPRIGYGAMRLLGPGFTEPPDRRNAVKVLRRSVELGVRVIDTAWYYGFDVVNRLIAEALRPYPDDLVLATKIGGRLTGRGIQAAMRPEYLREANDHDREVLGVDTVPLTHLRWLGNVPTDGVPFEDAFGTMIDMRTEGRIRNIGLSQVTLEQLAWAHTQCEIASVSNAFSLDDQRDSAVVDFCARHGIPYLPYGPLLFGGDSAGPAVAAAATELGVSSAQIRIAWLLAYSPIMLPIPGTANVEHLEDNVAAGEIAPHSVAEL